MRMSGKRTNGDPVVKAILIKRIVVNPHPLQVQINRSEFQTTIGLARTRFEKATFVSLEIFSRLRIEPQQMQVSV